MLDFSSFSSAELLHLIRQGIEIKKHSSQFETSLHRNGLLLLFQKTSTRTSLSFQSAIAQMGGYSVSLDWNKSNFAISPIQHEVEFASRNCDVIVARLKRHIDLSTLAAHSRVPVINGCDEMYHPTQALADLMTVYEIAGCLDDVVIAYVGVHNNVTNSLLEICMKLGVELILVTPIQHENALDQNLLKSAEESSAVRWITTVAEAASIADFIYTDTWIDMEFFNDPSYAAERDQRVRVMTPYQLNEHNLAGATPYLMHDMPIHPGFEIDEALIHSPKSVIYQQAENRMHVSKAILLDLLEVA